ncbi:hypothetical protein [Bacillus cereus]|uniref:hypothetical protein n=1 Tax=Bacillus cereus TaxID=1396 RepID=UPI00211D4EDD|nr:hypothetical protein [Bacillus cereus]
MKNGWSVVRHEIKVGKYRFCVIPLSDGINVSKVTSGAKVLSIPMSSGVKILTITKEDTMNFFEIVGEHLKDKIDRKRNFDELLEKARITACERLRKMPPIENVDMDGLLDKGSGVVH